MSRARRGGTRAAVAGDPERLDGIVEGEAVGDERLGHFGPGGQEFGRFGDLLAVAVGAVSDAWDERGFLHEHRVPGHRQVRVHVHAEDNDDSPRGDKPSAARQ